MTANIINPFSSLTDLWLIKITVAKLDLSVSALEDGKVASTLQEQKKLSTKEIHHGNERTGLSLMLRNLLS